MMGLVRRREILFMEMRERTDVRVSERIEETGETLRYAKACIYLQSVSLEFGHSICVGVSTRWRNVLLGFYNKHICTPLAVLTVSNQLCIIHTTFKPARF